jgi:uncharacterized protein YraI
MRSFSLAALASLALAAPALATADGPDAWRVVNVSASDVLNVRVGPGTGYFVISALPYNARGLQLGTCVPTVTREQYFALPAQAQQQLNTYTPWCVVISDGQQLGWVNRRYLTEDSL